MPRSPYREIDRALGSQSTLDHLPCGRCILKQCLIESELPPDRNGLLSADLSAQASAKLTLPHLPFVRPALTPVRPVRIQPLIQLPDGLGALPGDQKAAHAGDAFGDEV